MFDGVVTGYAKSTIMQACLSAVNIPKWASNRKEFMLLSFSC